MFPVQKEIGGKENGICDEPEVVQDYETFGGEVLAQFCITWRIGALRVSSVPGFLQKDLPLVETRRQVGKATVLHVMRNYGVPNGI